MPTEKKRLTIVIDEALESKLSQAKKEIFYNRNQSDMVRELLKLGLKELNKQMKDAT